MSNLKSYVHVKMVEAEPAWRYELRNGVCGILAKHETLEDGLANEVIDMKKGYKVVGTGDRVSWRTKEEFEKDFVENVIKEHIGDYVRGTLVDLFGSALNAKLNDRRFVAYKDMNFGQALELLKNGRAAARRGWNGKGIYIKLQKPDANSKMTQPYIYIVTTGLQTDNPDAAKGVVPWLASQTDMLAEDWMEVRET